MGSNLTYAAASLSAALVAAFERFGIAPIAAAHATGVPVAGSAARQHAAAHAARVVSMTALPKTAGRKADDPARPRGRRL
jgi:hypothetical protein